MEKEKEATYKVGDNLFIELKKELQEKKQRYFNKFLYGNQRGVNMATLYEFNNNKILIEENPLGIAKFVREEINQEFGNILINGIDELTQKIDSNLDVLKEDLEYYEYKVDEFATLISDIGERLKELEKMIDVPRINKKKVLYEINNLIRKVVPYE